MTPKLRPDASYDVHLALKKALDQSLQISCTQNGLLKSCMNCIHFEEQTESCGLANGLRPPARVIAYGCPKWEDKDEIPF